MKETQNTNSSELHMNLNMSFFFSTSSHDLLNNLLYKLLILLFINNSRVLYITALEIYFVVLKCKQYTITSPLIGKSLKITYYFVGKQFFLKYTN